MSYSTWPAGRRPQGVQYPCAPCCRRRRGKYLGQSCSAAYLISIGPK